MFCSSCGKSIPDESRYCLYCGYEIVLDDQTNSDQPLNQNVPIAIDNLYFWTKGPTEIRKGGFLSPAKIGRGFCIGFSLIDNNNKWTTQEGEVIIALFYSSMSAPTDGDKQWGLDLEKALRKSEFHVKVEIQQTDFKWNQHHNVSREWEELSYIYCQLDQLAYFENSSVIPHLWFRTQSKQLLYKKGDYIVWA